ncbi:hypothetical protein J5TS2_18510 [Brevibacillus halotolerans]|uniref:hypothetical protein n=1 Tax=Brevibacillus halotolerans TaxID=1507437 RepID=UPI001B2A876F|nr:hypothetical protein [Brevibacillus halotolerans]GIO01183.1 hypothetical protein J5TS2_18510 [Brevibacillus halotolerans]
MTDDNQIHLGIESRPLTLVDLKASLQMPASLPASAAFFYTPFTLMLDELADVLLHQRLWLPSRRAIKYSVY